MTLPIAKLAVKALLILTISTLFSSCKVGEDDPGISFRSRDNRLMGDWKLKKMNNVLRMTEFTPGSIPLTTSQVIKYDGFNLKITTGIENLPALDSALGFSYQMEIKENGMMSYDYTVVQSGLAGVKSGGQDVWFWLDADRNKSIVRLNNTFIRFGTLAGNLPVNILPEEFEVKELRKDKLVLVLNKQDSRVNLDGSYQSTVITSEVTFEAK